MHLRLYQKRKKIKKAAVAIGGFIVNKICDKKLQEFHQIKRKVLKQLLGILLNYQKIYCSMPKN